MKQGRRVHGGRVSLAVVGLALVLGAGNAGHASPHTAAQDRGERNVAAAASADRHPVIQEFLPQGRVSGVEAVQLRFAAAAAAFGDTAAQSPVLLECEGPVPQGSGRWLDDTRWTYVFDSTLPAGVRCEARANPGFLDIRGLPLPADTSYVFDTGAPSVVETRPYQGGAIDEEQVFILRFDAPVDAQAVAGNSHCVVQGLAEQIPVEALGDEHRASLMQAAYLAEPQDPAQVALLQCARVFPPEAQVRLHVGPGIRALGQPENLSSSRQAHVLEYEVRPPFTARFGCTRERAGQPCLPVAPVSVTFSAPIPAGAAEEIRLSAGDAQFPAQQEDDSDGFISSIRFPGPFPPETTLELSIPGDLRDDAGRPLENAQDFPLRLPMADYPPLVKFASGTFGVVERFAHGAPDGDSQPPAAVPVSFRQVTAATAVNGENGSGARLASLRSVDDADVLRWYGRLQRLDGGHWSAGQLEDILADRAPRQDRMGEQPRIDARSVSLLQGQAAARRLSLPASPSGEAGSFEVVGLPLQEPGFHVLEIESPRLGASLLEDGQAMYVRTGVLHTNLSLHLKQGRDDLLVWVTTLADALPVSGADIAVLDCHGRQLLKGRSDTQGVWHHRAAVDAPLYCADTGLEGLFVSARIPAEHPQAHGAADYGFVMSSWDSGIEGWRFNVPTSWSPEPDQLAHTVLDRSLYRAGETVSMKHYLREETRGGLGVPAGPLPDRLLIEHDGSAQRHELPLDWQATPSGGLAALSEFDIPQSAHLGSYSVRLTDASRSWFGSQRFRVEEFRLPMLAGQLAIKTTQDAERPDILVAPDSVQVDMQLSWLSGGPAAGLPVRLSAMSQARGVAMAAYEEYRFSPPPAWWQDDGGAASDDGFSDDEPGQRHQLFLNAHAFTLDANGMATVDIDAVPQVEQPRRFVFEADFADPNGEIQTLSQSVDIWPSSIQAGLKTESWGQAGTAIPVTLLALGTDTRPRQGVSMQLRVVERKVYTVRKRMVGGFYRYDSQTERKGMGTLCSGETNAQGVLDCEVRLDHSGSFELVAVAEDEQGRISQAYTEVWVSGDGETWFGGADDDRIDLIPAKREWAAGEQAEFQVRMPFRKAQALVSVEREGVLWTKLVTLRGKDPVIQVPVDAAWGPNAYVSVLVLRGRLYELPWRSFLDGGWHRPLSWLRDWSENPGDIRITGQVDLAKPAFRLGLAELRVAGGADRLQVEVMPAQPVLQVRENTRARIKVSLPDGKPAAHGTVAFAVVDEALLELSPNDSWSLYEAMHPRRALAVRTATSQMEVVGRRHYGRKAVAAGGGGGSMPTRQLFDTLLSWQPMVKLDEQGETEVEFSMNDSLSRFRLVALADHAAGYFGGAETTVVTRQDLQLVSGLPPVVREGDRYQAVVTLRNGTEQEREINVGAAYAADGKETSLPARAIRLMPGASGSVSWDIVAPWLPWPERSAQLDWRFQASDGGLADRLAIAQRIEPRLPVTTVQADLLGLSAGDSADIPVKAPWNAQRGAYGAAYGGVALTASSTLAGGQEGVRDWWLAYPYTCLEQSASQALALNDPERWDKVVARLTTQMDGDGLLRYFPGTGPGSEVLTAYLVSAQDEARRLGLKLEIPQASLSRMLDGLQAFAEGRLKRSRPYADASLDSRRLMAMDALARHGRATGGMLDSLELSPERWPTPTIIDWLSVLSRLSEASGGEQAMQQARSLLVSRMTVSGTAMVFSDVDLNRAPGLMADRAGSQARLMLLMMDDPQWRDDMPLLVRGLLGLQRHGVWAMTTDNFLGGLALSSYSRHFETVPASGTLRATLGESSVAMELPSGGETETHTLDWPRDTAVLQLRHEGRGRAWLELRAQAGLQLTEPQGAGYRLERRIVPVQRNKESAWSRGDVYRVEIDIHSRDSASWVVLNDPVPAGATVLGSGLGRDSRVAPAAAEGWYPPAFVERASTAYRAYFDYLPAGRVRISYAVRLNAVGEFNLPPSRVEALYRPDLYGVFPNAETLLVEPGELDVVENR